MAKRSDSVQQSIESLRAEQQAFRTGLAKIQADENLSDVGKARAVDQLRAQFEAVAKASASNAWKDAAKARDALTVDLAKAHQAHAASYDHLKLDAMARRFKLLYAPSDDRFTSGSNATRMTSAYDEAVRMGDVDAQRALRLAGLEVLQHADPRAGTKGQAARALYQRMQRDEAADLPANYHEAHADLQAVEQLTAELEREILRTESTIAGVQHAGPFRTPSAWERDIFGRSSADRIKFVTKPGPSSFDDDEPDTAAD